MAGGDYVFLDGHDSDIVQRYIDLGHGRAAIQGVLSKEGRFTTALLEDPRSCVDVAQDVLTANFAERQDSLPMIVENLCHLIQQLGEAARSVGLG